MREQFEKLPSIKPFKSAFKFNEEIGEYVRNDLHYLQPEYSLGFFNGAWYAYQEQQKKIDAMQAEAEKCSISFTKDKDGNCLHFHHEFGHQKCMDCGATLKERPTAEKITEWAITRIPTRLVIKADE